MVITSSSAPATAPVPHVPAIIKLKHHRGPSGYNLFVSQRWHDYKRANPTLGFLEMPTMLARAWQSLPADARGTFRNSALVKRSNIKYEYKRGPTAYALYAKELWGPYQRQNPEATFSDVHSYVCEKWKSESQTVKDPFKAASSEWGLKLQELEDAA